MLLKRRKMKNSRVHCVTRSLLSRRIFAGVKRKTRLY